MALKSRCFTISIIAIILAKLGVKNIEWSRRKASLRLFFRRTLFQLRICRFDSIALTYHWVHWARRIGHLILYVSWRFCFHARCVAHMWRHYTTLVILRNILRLHCLFRLQKSELQFNFTVYPASLHLFLQYNCQMERFQTCCIKKLVRQFGETCSVYCRV